MEMIKMHISKNGLDLIKKYEGFYSKAYKCPAGVLTIGYGTTNADSKILNYRIYEDSKITKEKATEFLKKSIANKYEPNVNKYMSKYNFNQNQYDALVSFCYNIGSIDQLVNNGKKSIANIAHDMLLYDHAKGVRIKGLTKRREEEQKLFCTPIANTTCNEKIDMNDKKTVKYCITADSLNVRKGPGTNYGIVSVLRKGQKVDIIEYRGSWGLIANTGNWISLSYAKKCNAITNTVIKGVAYKVTSVGLNVRNGKSVSYRIVGVFEKGNILYIDKKSGSWGRIANTNNWVNLNYCKKV